MTLPPGSYCGDYYFLLTLGQIAFSVFLFMETNGTSIFIKMIWSSLLLIAGRIITTMINVLRTFSAGTHIGSTLSIMNPIMHLYTLGLSSFLAYLLITNSIFILFTSFVLAFEGCNIVYFIYYTHEHRDKKHKQQQYERMSSIEQQV